MKNFLYSYWKHKKTHNIYIIIGECKYEGSGESGFLYVRQDDPTGIPWVRAKTLFLDGRFEKIEVKKEN